MSKNDKKGTISRGPMELPVKQGADDGLPDWFHGIMSRRDCEELLKNKDIGYFIIRLSQRTFGYILSYQGKDRCRHFVINQLSNGELLVSGDTYSHGSLPDLISYYQNTPIEPFGEKLSLSYIKVYKLITQQKKTKLLGHSASKCSYEQPTARNVAENAIEYQWTIDLAVKSADIIFDFREFSENNKYDNIQQPNSKIEKSVSQHKAGLPKNNKGGDNPNGQTKQNVASAQDIAPPLPERNRYLDDNDEQIYAKPKKAANGNPYSASNNKDVHYSLVKETQINQKNIVKENPQNVLYSEVRLDHSLPSALGHLQGSSQSLSQDALKDSRKPRLISSLNEHSECEVLEMRFATSIQTVNSKTLSGPFLHARADNPSSSFLFPTVVSHSEAEDTYEQIPFIDPCYTNEYHMVDKISNYSMCTTNTFDQISTRTSKEVTSREINKKVAHASTAQDNPYETVSRDFTKLAVRKQNVAKVEKHKRFFFGDKKK